MVQRSSDSDVLSSDSDHHVVPFLTGSAVHVPTGFLRRSAGRAAAGPKTRVSGYAIHQAVVLDVAGRLHDVVQDLDDAVQRTLADGPRGVVCDLSAMHEDAEPDATEVLATAGRHVRDWPGIPVAVACPDPRVREALSATPWAGTRSSHPQCSRRCPHARAAANVVLTQRSELECFLPLRQMTQKGHPDLRTTRGTHDHPRF